jgi:hypothetical protein
MTANVLQGVLLIDVQQVAKRFRRNALRRQACAKNRAGETGGKHRSRATNITGDSFCQSDNAADSELQAL